MRGGFGLNKVLCTFYYVDITCTPHCTVGFVQLRRAQRSSPRKLTCSLWNVYSDALPECFAGGGAVGTLLARPGFVQSVLAVWSVPVASWMEEGSEDKTKARNRGGVINC